MKSMLCPGLIAGLSLMVALSAGAQTGSTAAANASSLATPAPRTPTNSQYEYDFIAKGFVWSNKPLDSTATKICKVMKDHSFAETAYAINGEQDWNACLATQIRSIGYLRWLKNDGFKPNSKNRKTAQAYLKRSYQMGAWGSYSFAQLSQAVKATSDPAFPH
jgi:hypothetical protein